MAFEDTKQMLGIGGRWRRYVREDDVVDLAELSDPTTLEDETRTSWKDVAKERPGLLVAGSLFAAVLIALVVWQASRFLPLIVHNVYVQAAAAATTLVLVGVKIGWSRRRSVTEHVDRLDLYQEDGMTPFYGKFIKMPNDWNLFIPMKGLSRTGQSVRPYRVRELSSQLPQQMSKVGMNEDAPASILVHPRYERRAETDLGTVVGVRSGELDTVPDGEHAVLRTTIPEYEDDDVDELARALEDKDKEATRWRERYRDLEREFANFREDIQKPVDERVENIMDHTKELTMVSRGRGRPRSGNGADQDMDQLHPNDFKTFDWKGSGSSPAIDVNGDDEYEEAVEEELAGEDDDA